MNAKTPVLEACDLTVRHRSSNGHGTGRSLEAVHQLSLELNAGQIVAIVGESGCGKSSFARSLLGLLPVASGSIRFRGVDIARMTSKQRRDWHRDVQLVFQDPHAALSPRRTIQQTLEEPLHQAAIPRASLGVKIGEALEAVNLSDGLLPLYPHQLSGGQKQRIALARALLSEPSLIVADEPLSALDVSEQARMLQLLSRLRKENNIGFLLVAHDLAMVQQVADRVGVMYLGRLVELADAEPFFRAAAHPYSQALLQAARSHWSPAQGGQPVLEGEPPSAMNPPAGCVFHPRCKMRLDQCGSVTPTTHFLKSSSSGLLHQVRCHLYPEA